MYASNLASSGQVDMPDRKPESASRPLSEECDVVSKELECLGQLLSNLEAQLEPVLMPQPPENGVVGIATPSLMTCPLGERIRSLSQQAYAMQSTVGRIARRIRV